MKPAPAAAAYDFEVRLDFILKQVREEVIRAASMHAQFASPHEGYAIIQEEVDELWEDIKKNKGTQPHAIIEAKQVAAMGVRYMMDIQPR